MKLWPWKKAEQRVKPVQGNGTEWLLNILKALMGPRTSSGIHMNEEKALTISAVATSIRIIGGTIGSLPLHVFRRTDSGGRELAARHWAYPLLHDSPNEYHTAFTWREMCVAHVLLWGDSFNRIEWLNNGTAGALYPLMPWDVEPFIADNGQKRYRVNFDSGVETLPDDEVLHVPGLCYNGLRGLSVIGKMRDAFGLAKTAEDLAGSFFANGAKVGGVLEVPGKMDPEAQKNLVTSLQDKLAGKDGAFKAIVLEEGAKFHGPTMMPFKDAQFLEIRKHQSSEIYGWFGVPPHLAGAVDRSTSWGTGIEQQDIGYAKHTITPLVARFEQEINRKLFGRGSRLYCKFALDALQRGDFKTRMEGYQIAVGRPFLSVNEVRELEDWNTLGEEYNSIALPLNTGMGADPAKPKTPEPEPAAPAAEE